VRAQSKAELKQAASKQVPLFLSLSLSLSASASASASLNH
jgi:hypothetical protein